MLETAETAKKALEKLFMWAFAWGIGSTLDPLQLHKFEKVLGEIFYQEMFPKGTIFDYFYSFSKAEGAFVSWEEIIPEFNYANGSFFNLVVPTNSTVA